MLYHRPEIVTEVIRQGKNFNIGKFWVANLQKSLNARRKFEKEGAPGTGADPNAIFLQDDRQPIPSFILQGGQTQRLLNALGSDLNFIDFLNRDQNQAPTEPPVFTPPEAEPRRMFGVDQDLFGN